METRIYVITKETSADPTNKTIAVICDSLESAISLMEDLWFSRESEMNSLNADESYRNSDHDHVHLENELGYWEDYEIDYEIANQWLS